MEATQSQIDSEFPGYHPLELAIDFMSIIKKEGLTARQVAERLKVAPSNLCRTLKKPMELTINELNTVNLFILEHRRNNIQSQNGGRKR